MRSNEFSHVVAMALKLNPEQTIYCDKNIACGQTLTQCQNASGSILYILRLPPLVQF